ncbi:MAG: penicillin acylase family protein [Deltaproteobacteria bacterium]|nr:penicillin acylase family protein [Deltaproteobacteria bacterium]
MRAFLRSASSMLAFVALVACGDDDGAGPPAEVYRARIVRTTYGIPHVTADDWGGLGFGAGYAYAQDNFCVLMREVVAANGQTARWFGEEEGSVADDLVYTYLNTDERARALLGAVSPELQQLVRGYAAGLSQHLAEVGVDGLAEGREGCRGAEWVRPITEVDLGKVYRKLVFLASADALTAAIAAAEAPTASMARLGPLESTPFDPSALGLPEPSAIGSNAYAIGGELTDNGAGMVLGNPHFYWQGGLRWYVQHLTIPGQLDVMGAALQGVPLVNIGFNENVAWSHTVSTGQRFTFYELHLLEDDPMAYQYGDEIRRIEPHPVSIEVRRADGTIEPRAHTLYTSHYGFVVDLGVINDLVGGWPTLNNTVFTFRDAAVDNTRVFEQFLGLDRAQSVDDVEQALELIGLPWVNTIAADREGNAFYGDVTTVPHVTREQLETCSDTVFTDALTGFGRAAMNGSRPECEWGDDPDGPPGLLGYASLPKLRNRTFVANANDSYWLSNPSRLLDGFSPLIGREEVRQSIRTRLTFVQVEDRLAGTDGLPGTDFTVEHLQQMLLSNRDHSAELAGDDVVAICEAIDDWGAGDCGGDPYSDHPTEAATVCGILAEWDRRYDVESVGAGAWVELWRRLEGTDDLWAIDFDPADPVHTPRDLNDADPAVVEAVRCALGAAVDFFVERDVPLDRPWGQLQYRPVGDDRIAIPGGPGRSAFSVISANWVEDEGYTDIFHGNSYVQTVTFDDTECPVAYSVLTYSQSADPASPHYADQTRLYTEERWHRLPFCEVDVQAAAISDVEITNAR